MSSTISPAHRGRASTGLRNATTVVDGANAPAPTAGQVIVALDDHTFEWQTAAAGYTDAEARAAGASVAADGQLIGRAGGVLVGVDPGDALTSVPRRTIAAPGAVAADDYAVDVSGAGALTLPAPADGRAMRIRKIGVGTVTLTPSAGLIDGDATLDIVSPESVDLIGDGVDWGIY